MACKRTISVVSIMCPTGRMEAKACAAGLHDLSLKEPTKDISDLEEVHAEVPGTLDVDSVKVMESCVAWLKNYFSARTDQLSPSSVPICPSLFNGSFRSHVLQTLRDGVPFGKTVSYGELAAKSGSAKASQSVGSAMRNNPISLIIPCHRVIRSNGNFGNYAGGTMNDTKSWLLKFEQKRVYNI